MKKCLFSFLSVFIVISSLINVNATVENKNDVEMIRAFAYTFDDKIVDVEFFKELKDIEGNKTYNLYKINESGYAVVTINGVLSEIHYESDASMYDQEVEYYIGPALFVNQIDYNELVFLPNIISVASVINGDNYESESFIQSLIEMNNAMLNQEISIKYEEVVEVNSRPNPTKPFVISGGTEIGISDTNFTAQGFGSFPWVNEDNNCGPYAAAAMLAYLNRFGSKIYFNNNSGSTLYSVAYHQWIIKQLKSLTANVPIIGGALTSALNTGVTKFLNANKQSNTVYGIKTSSESTFKSVISSGKPIVLSMLNHPNYGNHFVCAYKYVDYNGALWYKA